MVSCIRSFLALGVVFLASNLHSIDIFYEISQNNLKTVSKWAASNSDISVVDEFGRSPLHVAVLTSNAKMVKVVLKSRVNINQLDHDGKTALDLALDYGDYKIIKKLVKSGVRVTTQERLNFAKKILTQSSKVMIWIGIGFVVVGSFFALMILQVSCTVEAVLYALFSVTYGVPGLAMIMGGTTSLGLVNYRLKLLSKDNE